MLRYLVGPLPFTKGGSKASWKLKEGDRGFLLRETVPLEKEGNSAKQKILF